MTPCDKAWHVVIGTTATFRSALIAAPLKANSLYFLINLCLCK